MLRVSRLDAGSHCDRPSWDGRGRVLAILACHQPENTCTCAQHTDIGDAANVFRGGALRPLCLPQTRYSNERSPRLNGRRQPSNGGTSRMMREYQVRICEGLGVKFPPPTRLMALRELALKLPSDCGRCAARNR